MAALILGTLFGGWQAYRKNQFDAQQQELIARQNAILARENAWRAAVESDKIARLIIEPDGTISAASAGASKLVNIPESELVGQTLASLGLIAPGSAAELEAPPVGKTLRMSLPLNRRDKTPIQVEARATGIGEGQGLIMSLDRAKSIIELPAAD